MLIRRKYCIVMMIGFLCLDLFYAQRISIDNETTFKNYNTQRRSTIEDPLYLDIPYGTNCENNERSIPQSKGKIVIPIRVVKIKNVQWSNLVIAGAIAKARRVFEEFNIELKLVSDPIEPIEDPLLWDLRYSCLEDQAKFKSLFTRLSSQDGIDALNIVFLRQIHFGNCNENNIQGGVASWPREETFGANAIFMGNAFAVTPGAKKGLVHELGHAFGLFHLFDQRNNAQNGGDECDQGDFISDTPYIPFDNFTVCDPSPLACLISESMRACIQDAIQFTISLEEGQVFIDNYMNYSGLCRKEFTPFQKRKMYDIAAGGYLSHVCDDLSAPLISPTIASLMLGENMHFENTSPLSNVSNTSKSIMWELIDANETVIYSDTFRSEITITTGLNNHIVISGNYILRAFDVASYNRGCHSDTTFIPIVVGDGMCTVSANAGEDDSIFIGGSTRLNGSGGSIYNWSPVNGLNDPDIRNPLASPTITTTYTLTVTDETGCTDTDAVTITVSSPSSQPPINDEPCQALSLGVYSTCNYSTGTNRNATDNNSPSILTCDGLSHGDVWYQFIVPASGEAIIQLDNGVIDDMGMGIYRGTNCTNLTFLDCIANGSPDAQYMPYALLPNASIPSITPGETLWIRLWEFNNNNFGTFKICVFDPNNGPSNEGPDLVIQNVSVPGSSFDPNESVAVSYTIKNTGTEQASTFFYSAFLSQNTSVEPGVDYTFPSAGGFIEDGLSPQQTEHINSSMTMPDWPDGSYNILITADELLDLVPESNEDNNVHIYPISLGDTPMTGADILISQENVSPSTDLAPGMELNVTFDIQNIGDEDANNSCRTGIYFQQNGSVFNPNEAILLDVESTIRYKLDVGEPIVSESINVDLPLNLSSTGTAKIFMFGNHDNDITNETNFSNNIRSETITISTLTPAGPDFVGSFVEFIQNGSVVDPHNIRPYDELRVRYEKCNIGNLDGNSSDACRDQVIFSSDPIVDQVHAIDVLIGSDRHNGLDIGECDFRSESEPVIGVVPGQQYVIIQINYENELCERNYLNNTEIIPITIIDDGRGVPDIGVSIQNYYPYSSALGDSLHFDIKVWNEGDTLITGFPLRVFLSEDENFDGDKIDVRMNQGVNSVDTLYPGDTLCFRRSDISRHLTREGQFFALAIADESLNFYELRKTNNVSAVPVLITSIDCYYSIGYSDGIIDTLPYTQSSNGFSEIKTEQGCSFTLSTSDSWIYGIPSGTITPNGSGEFSFTSSAFENNSPILREGYIEVEGSRLPVIQSGKPCELFTLSSDPDSISVQGFGCGQEIILTVEGDPLHEWEQYYWYKNSTQIAPFDTGKKISVYPAVTTRYYVRLESTCNEGDTISELITIIDTLSPTALHIPTDTMIFCGNSLPENIPTFVDACDTSLFLLHFYDEEQIGCENFVTKTWTASDESGNTTIVEQIITLIDSSAPLFNYLPPDTVVSCNDPFPELEAIIYDWCQDSIGVSISYGDIINNEIIVTYIADDYCGNVSTATSRIIITDLFQGITVTDTIPSGIYNGIDYVASEGVVDSGSIVLFRSPNEVVLFPNFHVLKSSEFGAIITQLCWEE